jgi:hypothetical protein
MKEPDEIELNVEYVVDEDEWDALIDSYNDDYDDEDD